MSLTAFNRARREKETRPQPKEAVASDGGKPAKDKTPAPERADKKAGEAKGGK